MSMCAATCAHMFKINLIVVKNSLRYSFVSVVDLMHTTTVLQSASFEIERKMLQQRRTACAIRRRSMSMAVKLQAASSFFSACSAESVLFHGQGMHDEGKALTKDEREPVKHGTAAESMVYKNNCCIFLIYIYKILLSLASMRNATNQVAIGAKGGIPALIALLRAKI